MKTLLNLIVTFLLCCTLTAQEAYLVAIEANKHTKIQYVKDTTQVNKIVKRYYKGFQHPNTVYCDLRTEKYHIYIERKEVVQKKKKKKYKKIKV